MTAHEKYMLEGLFCAMGASPDAAKEAADTHAKLQNPLQRLKTQQAEAALMDAVRRRDAAECGSAEWISLNRTVCKFQDEYDTEARS
jgi:hypothetical protein